MKRATHTAGRNFVLSLMLLLAVAASLVSFSYDADAQDDIPPVTVELKFLPQAPIVSHNAVLAPFVAAPSISGHAPSDVFTLNPPTISRQSSPVSPQLSLTLRC
jgi:hypothetical protein